MSIHLLLIYKRNQEQNKRKSMKCLVGINSLLIPNKLKTGLLKCGPTESTNPNLIQTPKTYFLYPKSYKILLIWWCYTTAAQDVCSLKYIWFLHCLKKHASSHFSQICQMRVRHSSKSSYCRRNNVCSNTLQLSKLELFVSLHFLFFVHFSIARYCYIYNLTPVLSFIC